MYTFSDILQVLGSGIEFGLLNSLFVLGITVAFRFGNFPDLTVEGSIIVGATLAAIVLHRGYDPVISLLIGALAGALAGFLTAGVHILTGMSRLLSGIVMMTVLYALSLRFMQGSNLAVFDIATWFPANAFWFDRLLLIAVIVAPVSLLLLLFLHTELGLLLRATAENAALVRKLKRPCNLYLIIAMIAANGLVGLSGAILANYNRFADVSFGTGTIIMGLAALLIGETLLPPTTVARQLAAAVLGSVVYYTVYAFALRIGLHPWDLKIVSAAVVVATVSLSRFLRTKYSRIRVGSNPL